MEYIVIETHGGLEYASIVTDESGKNKIFYDYDEALEEAAECQEGVVFPSEQVVCGWSVEDILVRAEDDEVELTKTEAREILDRIMHKADMSVGVNWDTISYFIREYCEKRD